MVWTMPYVYHLCADDFRGEELYPQPARDPIP
jgi:hypothetical protein